MNKIKTQYLLKLGLLLFVFNSCTEEIDFKTESFESALVIEATITNELKKQELILSRTFMFEEDGPNPETNAEVKIISDNGEFIFQEIEDGKYASNIAFKAEPNTNYALKITTSNGQLYSSLSSQLTQNTQIDQLYAVRETNNQGINGMSIYVDSYDPTGNSKYYRYEYEETYKIIAPSWVPEDIIVLEELYPCTVALVQRTQEEQICYNTVKSININQTNTNALTEDRVTRQLVRFIDSKNYILSHRYSILTKQYIQSQQSYTYYETLNHFSEEGSLLSQVQPGFINSNVFSESNPKEKVLGFFDVSSVHSKRIYFNYTDFFLGENIPPFPVNCIPTQHLQIAPSTPPHCGSLISELLRDRVVYHHGATNILDTLTEDKSDYNTYGPFYMVPRQCGDCTALGNNVAPDFWEE